MRKVISLDYRDPSDIDIFKENKALIGYLVLSSILLFGAGVGIGMMSNAMMGQTQKDMSKAHDYSLGFILMGAGIFQIKNALIHHHHLTHKESYRQDVITSILSHTKSKLALEDSELQGLLSTPNDTTISYTQALSITGKRHANMVVTTPLKAAKEHLWEELAILSSFIVSITVMGHSLPMSLLHAALTGTASIGTTLITESIATKKGLDSIRTLSAPSSDDIEMGNLD